MKRERSSVSPFTMSGGAAGWALLISLAGGCEDSEPARGANGAELDQSGQDEARRDDDMPDGDMMIDDGMDVDVMVDEDPIPDREVPDPVDARVTLENHGVAACHPETIVQALPEERGHWAAERLVPPTTPFLVDAIEYQLSGQIQNAPTCAANLSHQVFVVSAPDGLPPASPAAIAGYRVFDVRLPDATSTLTQFTLDPPLEVDVGEALFVGVEIGVFSDLDDTQLCVGVCKEIPERIPGVSFWSNAASAPYPWADLVEVFELPNYSIRAYGMPAR